MISMPADNLYYRDNQHVNPVSNDLNSIIIKDFIDAGGYIMLQRYDIAINELFYDDAV